MSEQRNGRTPARSRVAMAVLKGGLAFGAVWMLTLLSLLARVVFDLV